MHIIRGWFAVLQSKGSREISGGLNSNVVKKSMYILNKANIFYKTLQIQWCKNPQ